VVVTGQQRSIDINSVGGGLAQAVSGESHFERRLADITWSSKLIEDEASLRWKISLLGMRFV
jgi:hypothetical protein